MANEREAARGALPVPNREQKRMEPAFEVNSIVVAAGMLFTQLCFDQGWLMLSLAGNVLLFPPFLFLTTNIGDERTMDFRFRVVNWSMYAAVSVVYALHYVIACGWMDGATARLCVELTRSAADLVLLPVYFGLVRTPSGDEGWEEEEESGAAVGLPLDHLSLPGGLRMLVVPEPGSAWITVLGSKELRAAVTAICLYILLTGCSLAGAAAAVGLGLMTADTTLSLLTVAAAVSLLLCLPRLRFSGLNTHPSTVLLFCLLIPAALTVTHLVRTSGAADMESIWKCADAARNIVRIFLPYAFLVRTREEWEA